MRQKHHVGFTLVELLVVIGVISVLIAILLPAMNRAREQANRIKCASNMRTLGLGLQMYLNDNHGIQPLFATYGDRAGSMAQEYLYVCGLAQYVGVQGVSDQAYQPGPGGRMFAFVDGVQNGPIRRSVFFCPSEQYQPQEPVIGGMMQWMGFTSYGTCYRAWNPSADNPVNSDYIPTAANFLAKPGYWMSRRLYRQKNSSSNVAIFAHITAYDHFTYLEVSRLATWVNFSYDTEPNHLNTLPVCFLDGHVDSFHFTDVQDPTIFGPNGSIPLWYSMTFP